MKQQQATISDIKEWKVFATVFIREGEHHGNLWTTPDRSKTLQIEPQSLCDYYIRHRVLDNPFSIGQHITVVEELEGGINYYKII